MLQVLHELWDFGNFSYYIAFRGVTLRYDGGAVEIDTRKNHEQLYKTFI